MGKYSGNAKNSSERGGSFGVETGRPISNPSINFHSLFLLFLWRLNHISNNKDQKPVKENESNSSAGNTSALLMRVVGTLSHDYFPLTGVDYSDRQRPTDGTQKESAGGSGPS